MYQAGPNQCFLWGQKLEENHKNKNGKPQNKIKTEKRSIYTDVDLSRRLDDPDIKAAYDEIISSKSFPPNCLTQEKYDELMLEDDVIEDWPYWKGNNVWERYLYIPAEYNSCLMYRGNIWHTITYDPTVEDVRYSLVSVIR